MSFGVEGKWTYGPCMGDGILILAVTQGMIIGPMHLMEQLVLQKFTGWNYEPCQRQSTGRIFIPCTIQIGSPRIPNDFSYGI